MSSHPPFQRTCLNPHATERYNFHRDPAFMVDEHVPDVSVAGMPTPADVAKNNGVPPIAIPYMALQNLNRPDGTGKRIIVPMVVGFESTFLANSLQGLLCLPGCESVFMGEPVNTTASAPQKEEEMTLNANDEEAAGVSTDEGDTTSVRSSSSPSAPPQPHGSGSSSPRSPSSNGSDINSLGPSGEIDAMTTEETADSATRATHGCHAQGNRSGNGDGTNNGGGRKNARALRGGIRCHGSARIKTAVSRAYADFVLQHLEDGEIQLKTPAPRSTSAETVSDKQLDDAGELETLRGQTPNVPRCMAPVPLPEERYEGTGWHGEQAAREGKGLSSSPQTGQRSTTAAGSATSARSSNNTSNVTVVARLNEAAKLLLTTSEHSCSDNSPTPSSGDGDDNAEGRGSSADGEGEEDGANGEVGSDARHRHHHTVSTNALAGETRVGGLPTVAHDCRRFTCFASNSVANMPEYHFPRLVSDDLVELTAFMVVRSSVQPDEAVDLQLAPHILGDPQGVALRPVEERNALIARAARLMEAAVFLQI
jgi:hypothetical protein